MTNEELVEQIQSGDDALIPLLWEQVEKFIYKQAGIRARQLGGFGGVSIDDLYQQGFLALVEAVGSYDTQRGMSFIGWLAYHLRNAFRDAVGYQSDAMLRAKSLDAPLVDGEDMTLADVLPDPTDAHEGAEERLYHEQLRRKLDVALDTLPDEQADTIRRRYFRNQTLKQISEQDGIAPSVARQRESMGLRKLRHPKISAELRQFVEERTPYFMSVGVGRFQNSHTSAVEEIVMLRERLEGVG